MAHAACANWPRTDSSADSSDRRSNLILGRRRGQLGSGVPCQLAHAARANWPISEHEPPGLRDLPRAEHLGRPLRRDQLEAAALVDAAGGLELALRPERQLAVADGAGEADALLDQLRADLQAARRGVDDQEAQLCDAVARVDAEDRADGLAVEGRDPAALARRVVAARGRPATICATSASKLESKPYSRAYRAPWRWITQPYSPGAAGGSRATGRGFRRRATPRWSTSRRAGAPGRRAASRSSSSEACSAERRSSSAKARRPAAASETSCARPSAGERLRATMPAASRPESTRLRCPGSSASDERAAEAVVSRHLPELVDHARLGQRVRRIEQPLVQEADLARPEAAEAAGAVCGRDGWLQGEYLPLSTRLACQWQPYPIDRRGAGPRRRSRGRRPRPPPRWESA